MLLTHYYALGVFACALTAAWVLLPRERTQITTLGAFVGWSLLALLGDQTEVFDPAIQETVTENNTTIAVQTTGQMVSAPLPDEVRLFAGLWALLSALALVLYVLGAYPPVADAEEHQP